MGRNRELRNRFVSMRTLDLGQSICMCVLSRVQLFVNPWTVARQAPLPMELSRQEHWSGLPRKVTKSAFWVEQRRGSSPESQTMRLEEPRWTCWEGKNYHFLRTCHSPSSAVSPAFITSMDQLTNSSRRHLQAFRPHIFIELLTCSWGCPSFISFWFIMKQH